MLTKLIDSPFFRSLLDIMLNSAAPFYVTHNERFDKDKAGNSISHHKVNGKPAVTNCLNFDF